MDPNLKAAQDAIAATTRESKIKLGATALATIDPADYQDLFNQDAFKDLLSSTPEAAKNLAGELTKSVAAADKPAVAKAAVAQLTDDQKRELARSVLGAPSPKTRDSLWLIVIWTLVVVMLLSVLVLAINVFRDKDPLHEPRVSPEVMLSLFTSVFGFLVGLFVPSPGGSKNAGDGQ